MKRLMTRNSTALPLIVACLVVMVAVACLSAILPQQARAAEGDAIGYAYLDADKSGAYTALVVQDVARSDEELNAGNSRELGAVIEGQALPWDLADIKDTYQSMAFVKVENAIQPKSLEGWFQDRDKVTSIDVSGLDTSQITDMSFLFSGCKKLESLDLSPFDVSNVETMARMFEGCESLKELDLSSFELDFLSDVKTGAMFWACAPDTLVLYPGFADCFTEDSVFPVDADLPYAPADHPEQKLTSLEEIQEYLFDKYDPVTFVRVEPDAPSDFVAEGTSGSCEWSLDREGVLTIAPADGAAEGALDAWTRNAPWSDNAADITAVKVEGTVKTGKTAPGMFKGCTALESVDLTGLDTSASTNLSSFFQGCTALQSVDLTQLNTAKATNLSNLFLNCTNLQSVDLTQINTGSATNLSNLLAGCASLEQVDLSALNLGKVTNLSSLLARCKALTSIDFTGVEMPKARDLSYMLQDCTGLETVDASGLELAGYANLMGLFSGCTSLVSAKAPSSHQGHALARMFMGCSSLTDVDLGCLRLDEDADISGFSASEMFSGCTALEGVDLSPLAMPKYEDVYDAGESANKMFAGCTSLRSVALPTLTVYEMSNMFNGCTALESLDLSALATDYEGMGPDLSRMCEGCDALKTIHVGAEFVEAEYSPFSDDAFPGGLWQSSADGKYYVLREASWGADAVYTRITRSAEVLPYAVLSTGELRISTITPGESMPDGAYLLDESATYGAADDVPWHSERASITSVKVEGSVQFKSFAHWFEGCTSLQSADLSGLDGSRAKSMAGMFSGCTALESITFGDLNTASVKDFSEMFRNCTKLAALDLSSFDTRGATAMRRMFHGCDSLASVTLGNYFGFRGAATHRLPGGEFPNGAWRQDESDTAYVSNSIPSMKKATYAKCTDEELAQAGLTLVEVRIEGTEEGEPRLQIDSEIVETDGELVEELEYSVSDEYPSETLFVGDSPRAASTKTLPSSTTTVTKTTLRSVKNNSRITKVVVPSKVSKIASRAFSGCKSVKTLTVKSPKLTTRSSVYRCLSGSNINKVTVSSISSSKKTSVRRAFAKWSGKTIRTA